MPAHSAQLKTDRTPFFGNKIPSNVVAMKKLSGKMDRTTSTKILRVAVSTLEGKPVQSNMLESISTPNFPIDAVHVVYAGFVKLLQSAFRVSSSSFTKEMFLSDVSTLNLPKEMVDDLTAAVFGSRKAAIETAVAESRPKLPSIRDVKWKIDVAISTTTLSRVLEPVVNMQLTLNTGEVKKFEMTVEKFQELRYSVASVLKEMEALEKRNILKVN